MASKGFWAGWVGFAGWLMILIGSIDFFQGLIAIIRDKYYVLAPNQIIVFDMTTWGWVMLIWGIVVALAGLGLLTRVRFRALDHDHHREPELHRSARIHRVVPVHALGADCDRPELHRPLRADRALGRCQGHGSAAALTSEARPAGLPGRRASSRHLFVAG